MNKLVLLLSLFLSFNVKSQEMLEKLQANTWYAIGDIYRGETSQIYYTKPTNYSADVNFRKNSELEMIIKTADDMKFVCLFEINKDKLKMTYSVNFQSENTKRETMLYYKIKELPNQKGYELIPINESEYN